MHQDHMGGLVTGGRQNFPGADVYVDRRDVAYWTDPARRAAAPEFLKNSFDISARWCGFIPSFRSSTGSASLSRHLDCGPHGHTPGHIGVRIEDGGQSLLMVSDMLFPVSHPSAADVGFLFEQDRQAAQAMRARFFPRAAEEKALIAATHMPFPGSGRIVSTAGACAGFPRSGLTRVETQCARYNRGVHMSRKLEGKIAVVTGGSSGIGLATAQRFAREGAHVFVTGRRQAELDAAAASIANAAAVRIDSSKLAELDTLFDRVRAEKGRIDVLFVNAGGGSLLPLGEITEEQFDDTFDRNVKGVLFTVQKALPLLADHASVILTGSTAATVGTAAFSVYGASKAAVRSFVRHWILDTKGRNIRFNTLTPGPTKTPGLVDLAGPDAAQQQALLDHLASLVPMGRVGDPDEIAKAAVFLASDDSSFVTGTELFVDGGQAQT
jgi:NAD(P)-dependent dehydrogenase (short-subunit alcohol dehydrogenase family)